MLNALHAEYVYFTLFNGEGNTGAFQKGCINAYLFTKLPPWGFSEKLNFEKYRLHCPHFPTRKTNEEYEKKSDSID